MKLVNIAVIIACASLGACDSLSSKDLDKEKFEAYLKLKRIPLNDEERYQRLKKEYNQKLMLLKVHLGVRKLQLLVIKTLLNNLKGCDPK